MQQKVEIKLGQSHLEKSMRCIRFKPGAQQEEEKHQKGERED